MKISLLLLLPFFAISQDTTIKVTVPYSFKVERTVTGTRTLSVTLPNPKPDTIRIHDTIFVNTCPPQPSTGLKWSEWKGSFQSFIDSAIGGTAYIDKDVTPAAPVQVRGSITVIGDTTKLITNIHKDLFILHPNAKQVFIDLRIHQPNTTGSAFNRVVSSGTTFYDSLHNVNITGGAYAYQSSRGGKSDSMAITAMRNCVFKIYVCGIGVFSQDGPFRALHLRNVQIKTDTTHNIYVHPATSLFYDSVASLGAGKLFQHQYSGSGNGGYNTGKYSIFNRVYSNGKMFEMTSLKEGPIIITNSNIAPYTTAGVAVPFVKAFNTTFLNNGNGIHLAGELYNCKGGAWSFGSDTLKLINSDFEEISMRSGGVIISENSTVKWMTVADRGNDFKAYFTNSVITNLGDGRNGNGIIYLKDTPTPAAAYGQPYRPEIIKQLER